MDMTQFEMGLLLILSLALSVQFGYLWLLEQHVGYIAKVVSEIRPSPKIPETWQVEFTERKAKNE